MQTPGNAVLPDGSRILRDGPFGAPGGRAAVIPFAPVWAVDAEQNRQSPSLRLTRPEAMAASVRVAIQPSSSSNQTASRVT